MMITHKRLIELLRYSPESGEWRWLVDRGGTAVAGSRAGSIFFANVKAYRKICIDNIEYLASRLAWFYMTREWPKDQIDHIDGNGLNNQWQNLREALPSQNQQNQGIPIHNTSGAKNVHYFKHGARSKRWKVEFSVNDRTKSFGYYATFEEACARAEEIRLQLHGEFARRE